MEVCLMEAINIDEEEADWLHSMREEEEEIEKAKMYVDSPSSAPKGVNVKQGPRGGYYYETDVMPHGEKPPKIDADVEKPEDIYRKPETVIYYQARAGNNPKTESKLQMEAHIKNAESREEKKYYELMEKELEYPDMINIRDMMQGPNNDYDEDMAECWNYCQKVSKSVGIQKKECYRNATEMAISDPEGRIGYVEGYYIFRDFPVRLGHAWNTYTTKSGRKIHFDPTFQFAKDLPRGSVEENRMASHLQTDYRQEEIAYHGKEYTRDEVSEYIFSSELYGGVVRYDLIDQLEGAELEEQMQMHKYPGVGD
jgi:hypothetical protein